MKKSILFLLALFCLLSACSGDIQDDTTAPEPTVLPITTQPTTTAPTEPPTTEPPATLPDDGFVADGNINPLTGLCDGISDEALNRRPVAIMVSNSRDSLPQWGISKADIIWEMLAEGRISRFMAIFQDPSKIEKLASIRSARPYFIDIAQSYGAVFIHYGGSVPAYEAIKARSELVSMDGITYPWDGVTFPRDPDRRKNIGLEHSVYTSGELLEKALAKLKSPLELEGTPSAFTFSAFHSAQKGKDMEKVEITYSSNHKPYYIYDSETGTYFRYQYGSKHNDALHKEQIQVKNLFVLRMSLEDVPNSSLKLVEIGTTGKGEGMFFCEGKYIDITWEKASHDSPIAFFDTEGNELVCARGKTFVSVITKTADIIVE